MTTKLKLLPCDVAVREVTEGLPPLVRRSIHTLSARVAGHNDNERGCYEGFCSHDRDVAQALRTVYERAYRAGYANGKLDAWTDTRDHAEPAVKQEVGGGL